MSWRYRTEDHSAHVMSPNKHPPILVHERQTKRGLLPCDKSCCPSPSLPQPVNRAKDWQSRKAEGGNLSQPPLEHHRTAPCVMPHSFATFRAKCLFDVSEVRLERERRNAHYPTPEEPQRCVVCRQVTATIRCMECPNKVCQACVTRECLEKEESFLYFHHQHCLR